MQFKALCIMLLVILSAIVVHDHIKQPAIPGTGFQGLDKYRQSRIAIFTNDFGELSRYRAANQTLAPQENRVVFMGDSIMDYWKLTEFFPGQPYVNRGIAGETTSQMLVRFHQDVIALHPKTVLILGSNNDIAGNTGPMSAQDSEHNYAAMAEMAHANNINVVFGSILPVYNYNTVSQAAYAQRPLARIREINGWLKDYCTQHNLIYIDYFSALLDSKGMLNESYSQDGLHPNKAGYQVMAPLTAAVLK